MTIIPPLCHLADMGNNPDTWPASKLITTLDGIDPSSRGFPSRVVLALFGSLLLFSLFIFHAWYIQSFHTGTPVWVNMVGPNLLL